VSGKRSACDLTTAFAPTVGKPYEGELHVRFDEGAVETGRRSARPGHSPERGETVRGRRTVRATAPLLHSTTFTDVRWETITRKQLGTANYLRK